MQQIRVFSLCMCLTVIVCSTDATKVQGFLVFVVELKGDLMSDFGGRISDGPGGTIRNPTSHCTISSRSWATAVVRLVTSNLKYALLMCFFSVFIAI